MERNTLLLAAKAFPWRWAPYVLYRQAAWLWHALRRPEARAFLRGAAAAVPLLPAMWRERATRGARSSGGPQAPVPRAPTPAVTRGARH